MECIASLSEDVSRVQGGTFVPNQPSFPPEIATTPPEGSMALPEIWLPSLFTFSAEMFPRSLKLILSLVCIHLSAAFSYGVRIFRVRIVRILPFSPYFFPDLEATPMSQSSCAHRKYENAAAGPSAIGRARRSAETFSGSISMSLGDATGATLVANRRTTVSP